MSCDSVRQRSGKRAQQRSDEGTRQRLGQHPYDGKMLAKRQARPNLSSTANIMAANPAAAVAAGLAAEEAGAGAGGTEDPLVDVRAIFTMLGMKITQRNGMINAHNITGMDDFDYTRVDDAGSFVKVWDETSLPVATTVDMLTQRKLKGFLYWYHD